MPMTDLSPAAQAAMDAAEPCVAPNECPGLEAAIAAALRAAALHCKRDKIILLSLADELEKHLNCYD